MALDPSSQRRSISPESSGRDSPVPRQWRNQLSTDEPSSKDKNYRKYAAGVDRALALFDTALQEWADYISFLNKLLKALQARQPNFKTIPSKSTVAKRLSQCLKPSLPSGVHQKTLEVYSFVFSVIGKDGLSRDLPLYLPGLAPTLSFASLSVRSPFLALLEEFFLQVEPRCLRPALKSIILALLPGLEEESSEDFERTLTLMDHFKVAVRSPTSKEITDAHSTGDDFFWQCFFLAAITSQSRRLGALAYLTRSLPRLSQRPPNETAKGQNGHDSTAAHTYEQLIRMVTSPEPGLLLRCFAAGLADEHLLIQRGYLDLLVTHLPVHSQVLQESVKAADLELLMRAATGVVTRRDMSLNRRLWSWLLGPEPSAQDAETPLESPGLSFEQTNFMTPRTTYFEEYALQPLTQALLSMIRSNTATSPAERARPYRICLSLMDRWEVGGLVVPEVFMPLIDSVRTFKAEAPSKADFIEVLRSASVFFDGVESGLIYGEIFGLMAQAIGPGDISDSERLDKLALAKFILVHFNVREEEMVTVHAPLTALSILCMLEDAQTKEMSLKSLKKAHAHAEAVLSTAADLLELIPERAFPSAVAEDGDRDVSPAKRSPANGDLLKQIRDFYVNEQGNLEASSPPLEATAVGELLLRKASCLSSDGLHSSELAGQMTVRGRILLLMLSKTSKAYGLDVKKLVSSLHQALSGTEKLAFGTFSSILSIATHLHSTQRINQTDFAELVPLLVSRAWQFLSSSEPKFHVETVRYLWQLQTALSPEHRDVEAAICSIMVNDEVQSTLGLSPAERARSFSVLWTQTLQDNPSGSDRRAPKTPNADLNRFPRLAGMDNYIIMLGRPLFLMLDSLSDSGTQVFMTVKNWLGNLVGIDKMFLVFTSRLLELPFLRVQRGQGVESKEPTAPDAEDDLDLAFYYLRSLSTVFRWAPQSFWAIAATKTISADDYPALLEITGEEGDIPFLRFFLFVCLECIAYSGAQRYEDCTSRASNLHRCALGLLHQILTNPYAERLSKMGLEDGLIDRLTQSLEGPDPFVQVLLLDVVLAALKLRDMSPTELPQSPTNEKRALSLGSIRGLRLSLSEDRDSSRPAPPAALLKCLQAGLSASSSRPVLDSWVAFFAECLPLYSDSIFQVLIPLVETLCEQVNTTFTGLHRLFREAGSTSSFERQSSPESTLISLLSALEQILARGHDRLLAEEARAQVVKSPDTQQGFFGNMVSGVFSSDNVQTRSATANDRLTVLLAFQDAVRMCFKIWSWGQGRDTSAQDSASAASFIYTALRMRNRARRLLEHLFTAEPLECLETVIGIWRDSNGRGETSEQCQVFNLLPALDNSRPKHTIPAIFNAIYSRTNPGALDPARKSTLTISLEDTDIAIFLVDYARSLEDDAMDEIWQDCMVFLKDLLGNPFPHRQILPCLLEFAAILGEKVDNTNFGEQRRMRRELGDLFLRLLTALFTTRPAALTESSALSTQTEKPAQEGASPAKPISERAEDAVGILTSVVPQLPKILVESDRVLTAATAISNSVVGPALRSKSFPESVSRNTLRLLQELSRLPNNQKSWKKDVGDAFSDHRFFNSSPELVEHEWLPLLRQWTVSDREKMPDILSKITPPTTAGIVFGVGATSARLEADRRTQLNLRRIATLVLASTSDAFVTEIPAITEKLVELLAATSTSSPSSTTRAEIYMVLRALVLKTTAIHLAPLWPVVNGELHAAISSVVAPDNSTSSDTYNNHSILQACKLLDLLVCVAPDDFQLHEWLFVTDTVEAVYRSSSYQPVALVDELSEELGSVATGAAAMHSEFTQATAAAMGAARRPLLAPGGGILGDNLSIERKDELVAKVLRPFFGQLSIFAFESTYGMGVPDWEGCVRSLWRDLFDERSMVRAL